jgi:2-polyprenyl-3-methyl-5-hydroxy-6-metoxy-1,4-benzoquinol methylase
VLGIMTEYDDHAAEYATFMASREGTDPYGLLPVVLELLGDIAGQRVLDAGCGEGYLARALAGRGARVTGIDLSPQLIEQARAKDPAGDYRVADLSQPLPAGDSFDAVGSFLVLNDVADYRGFASTLGTAVKPGGRLVIAFNNPYSAVIDRHAVDYFDSGLVTPYRGLWARGIKTYYHHRTLAEYLDTFLGAGLSLTRLIDSPALADTHKPDAYLPEGGRFPRFMILAFGK